MSAEIYIGDLNKAALLAAMWEDTADQHHSHPPPNFAAVSAEEVEAMGFIEYYCGKPHHV